MTDINFSPVIHIDSRADREQVQQAVEQAVQGASRAAIELPEYITAHLSTPFQWGEHDCITFAIGWLSIVAGRNLLAPYRPWHDERSALIAMCKVGGLEHQFNIHLKRIAPGYACDGDVTLVEGTAYLFSGAHIVGPGRDGLVFKSRLEAPCAWRLEP